MANRASSRPIPRPPRTPRGDVAALVVAAGSSSRMGEPKPVMHLLGKPLLAHTLDALRASRISEIIVVLGAEAELVRAEVPLDGTHVVVNPDYREGMSSSIRAGLHEAPTSATAFLVVLGDQPLVKTSTVDALLAGHQSSEAPVLVPTYRGTRGNPVLLDRSLASEIEAIRGDVGCREVVAAHAAEVVEVPVDDPGILLDVDTPEDLRRIKDALRDSVPLDRLVQR